MTKDGATKSHVFRGAVSLRLVDGTESNKGSVVLRENESARVERIQGSGRPAIVMGYSAADPRAFARRMVRLPKVLDLLDIVADGNGLGKRREAGIDPTTGVYEGRMYRIGARVSGDITASIRTHCLMASSFPLAAQEPVVLDSAGHTFDGFPRTDVNGPATYGSIWARAAKVKPDYRKEDVPNHDYWIYAFGQGEEFMPERRGLLGMSASSGITFSLDAMRKTYHGARPARFRAVAGMASDRDVYPNVAGLADLWVFVDGQVKFKRTQFGPQDGAFSVNVEIGPTDHFLRWPCRTAATGSTTTGSSWAIQCWKWLRTRISNGAGPENQ